MHNDEKCNIRPPAFKLTAKTYGGPQLSKAVNNFNIATMTCPSVPFTLRTFVNIFKVLKLDFLPDALGASLFQG